MRTVTKCKRCNNKIDPSKSAFCVTIHKVDPMLVADIGWAKDLTEDDVAIHVNGDRECKREVAGYRKMLLEAFDMPKDYDISFLDNF